MSKETLLHGSYADYIKEYSARSTRGSGNLGQSSSGHQPQQVSTATLHDIYPRVSLSLSLSLSLPLPLSLSQTPAMLANLAAAYQKALTQFTTKLAQQDPSKVINN